MYTIRMDHDYENFSIALANMLNEAHDKNVASCPFEGLDYNKYNNFFWNNKLISKKYHLAVGIMIGYDSLKVLPRKRIPYKELLTYLK